MEKRQKTFNSVSVEFKLTETVTAGTLSKDDPMFKGSTPVPAKDTILESTNKIVFDGNRVRIERNHPVFRVPKGELIPHRMEVYYTDEVGKLYYPNGVSNEGTGAGLIQDVSHKEAVGDSLFLPIVMFVRGGDRVINPYPFAQFRPTGTKRPIGKVECLEYSCEPGPGGIMSAWVAPTKEYVALRFQHQRRGKLGKQSDMSYRLDPNLGWVLDSWTTTRYSPEGAVTNSTKGQVTDLRVGERFDDAYFDVRFAENTEVFDQRNRKYYRVKSDGSMREISQTGEELSGTEYQPGTSWYRRNRWLLGTCTIVVIALAVAAGMRRRSR
jgi:hypothetical protein